MTERHLTQAQGLGIGIGRLGMVEEGYKPPTMTLEQRAEKCAAMGHPGALYNDWLDRTFCDCGKSQPDGDTTVPHVACCGGPLDPEPYTSAQRALWNGLHGWDHDLSGVCSDA